MALGELEEDDVEVEVEEDEAIELEGASEVEDEDGADSEDEEVGAGPLAALAASSLPKQSARPIVGRRGTCSQSSSERRIVHVEIYIVGVLVCVLRILVTQLDRMVSFLQASGSEQDLLECIGGRVSRVELRILAINRDAVDSLGVCQWELSKAYMGSGRRLRTGRQ